MKKQVKNSSISKKNVEIISLKKNLLNLRFKKANGQLEKTSDIRKTRRKIATLMTEISNSNGEKNA
tara:strand:- start:303 stop:500 length:198 start_codon:yes stop_codon:yes gene_type:complete